MINEPEYNKQVLIELFNSYPDYGQYYFENGINEETKNEVLNEIYLEIINDEDLLEEYERIESELINNNKEQLTNKDIVLVKPNPELTKLIKKLGWKQFIFEIVKFARYKKDQMLLLNQMIDAGDWDKIAQKVMTIKKTPKV